VRGKIAAKTELVHLWFKGSIEVHGWVNSWFKGKRFCIAFKNLAQEQDMVFVATLLGTIPKGVGS
jgi:hypothetical protein